MSLRSTKRFFFWRLLENFLGCLMMIISTNMNVPWSSSQQLSRCWPWRAPSYLSCQVPSRTSLQSHIQHVTHHAFLVSLSHMQKLSFFFFFSNLFLKDIFQFLNPLTHMPPRKKIKIKIDHVLIIKNANHALSRIKKNIKSFHARNTTNISSHAK